jgi:PAS domain S-box-containing protein
MDESSMRILDELPQYVGSTDSSLRCRYANRAYAELLGRTPETMVGLPIGELWGENILAEVMPFIRRALAGERVSFSKRIRRLNGDNRFGKVSLVPDGEGGYSVVIQDLDGVERHFKDRDRLLHELDHRVNNILQILQSVLAIESQAADKRTIDVLDAIKARVDALALSYELISGAEPAGGWPAAAILDRIAYGIGPGVSASCASDGNLRIPHDDIETFVFIAMEIARWAAADGSFARMEARRVPEGMELSAEGDRSVDLTTKAGAAGIALVESFARGCGAGPLRGGSRLSIIFPLREDGEPASGD